MTSFLIQNICKFNQSLDEHDKPPDKHVTKSFKRKGGAEKIRQKKIKLLAVEAEKCEYRLTQFFYKSKAGSSATDSNDGDYHSLTRTIIDEVQVLNTNDSDVAITQTGPVNENELLVEPPGSDSSIEEESALTQDQRNTVIATFAAEDVHPNYLTKNFFQRSMRSDLGLFFSYHPCQPSNILDDKGKQFNTRALFYQENDRNRKWLSYCQEKNAFIMLRLFSFFQ